jgi:prepilin-type N-terminal cleavage/methylation domain-containing protein
MKLQRVRSGRDEGGFTLTELLVTVTISGIISLAVAQSFLLVLKLGPETTARNKFATDGAFLINTLSDDVANATAQPTGITTYNNCDIAADNNSPRESSFGTFALPNGQSAQYKGTIFKGPNWSSPTYANVWSVTITRIFDPGGGGALTTTTMVQGYCVRASTNVFSTPAMTDPSYALDVKMMPNATEVARTISFRGDRRTLPSS